MSVDIMSVHVGNLEARCAHRQLPCTQRSRLNLFGCCDNAWCEARVAGGNPIRKIIDMLETMRNKVP